MGNLTCLGQWSESATSYNVYQSSTAGSKMYPTTNPNYRLLNLQRGIPYYFKVTAVNSFGEGVKSDEASGIP